MLRNNKVKLNLFSVALMTVLLFPGCSCLGNFSKGYNISITGNSYPKIKANDVILTYMNDPNKSQICNDNVRVGIIRVQPKSQFGHSYSFNEMEQHMKVAAASIGANAVYGIAGGENTDMVGYAIHCL